MDGMRNIRDVGYEGKTIDEVIDALLAWRVLTLVDVRLNAISRKKGFSKTALRTALENAGLSYVHLPALGNPKANRAGFYSPGTTEAANAHGVFLDSLDSDGARDAMDRVEELSQAGGVALLCFEHDHRMCHRSLIRRKLEERQLAYV
jgi:uncharacterized protein (DUF488 family)